MILNLRLRGGCPRTSNTKGPISFKDAVKGRSEMNNKSDQSSNIPGSYIVEQVNQVSTLTINLLEINDIYSNFHSHEIICKFNDF